ncbi:aminotransferase, classes I and II family protein [Histomonas meleagridis]|uniref:aminotransferase, classes I and II family protein n=1 Tax=Histomonas meleagridis TaxID=135588 RepID=UPI003559F6B4|nr:aminotransferase, classes I and II family protein [Histomonas meleagridis]KAH0806687.1 aminotransferase, classes I and II family protein [Histomonas meleagridis]
MLASTFAHHSRSFVERSKNFVFDDSIVRKGVIKAQYAVRGDIIIKQGELIEQMKKGVKMPFKDFIPCNIGNPFAVGKKSLTFTRQLVAAVEFPELMDKGVLPDEVCQRAKQFLASANIGAYSPSPGVQLVREDIARFIQRRDGYECKPQNIFLTEGASQAVQTILDMIISDPNVGILLPFPTYPLYTATIDLYNGKLVPIYLNEDKGWEFNVEELEKTYQETARKGVDPRALVVINPGNPTGRVLSQSNMEKIVDFCEAHQVMLLADEVYQDNIYDPNHKFVSFKKVCMQKGTRFPLFSFHSISKGFMGECGHRAGYLEAINVHQKFYDQLNKLRSINLSSNSVGQLLFSAYCNPPKSPECKRIWDSEVKGEIASLAKKSKILVEGLNKINGIHSQPVNSAMYSFPRLNLPKKAIEAASKSYFHGKQLKPDSFWCMKLLEATGIVVVPGSGHGQVEGTYHFRTTFLPTEQKIKECIERMTDFQTKFMQQYAD